MGPLREGWIVMDWFFQDGAWIFGVPACVGSILFLLKFLLMAIGVDHALDTDVGFADAGTIHTPVDTDVHVGDKLGGKDLSATRRWISFQGMIVLLMAGGWSGLMLFREAGWGVWSSGAVGVVVGVAAMWVFGMVFEQLYKLQISGNIGIGSAVGKTGEVYAGVPAKGGGLGQVMVVIDQKQRIYNAESRGGELPRAAKIVVVGTGAANTVVVDRAPDA